MQKLAGIVAAGILLTIAVGAVAQDGTAPTADLTTPIDLGQRATLEASGARLHANGTALGSTVNWALSSATVKVFEQRHGPCADRDVTTCPPMGGFERAQQETHELDGAEIRIESRDGTRIALVGGSSSSTDLEATDAVLRVTGSESRVAPPPQAPQLSEFSDAIDAGSAVIDSNRGAWSLIGSVQIIPNDAIIRFSGTDDGESISQTVQTGWAWTQADGVWYRELHLVLVSGNGAIPITWNGPVRLAASLPFQMESSRLESPSGVGMLPDGTRANGGGVALSDVVTEVRGVITPSSGPSRVQVAFTDAAAVPPAQADEGDDASFVKVGGTAAATAAAVVGAAWYWPRLRWGAAVMLMPMYSRLQKSELLEHDVRERLYDVIKKDPGIHAHALASEAHLGWGTTVYHLRLLEKNRLVTSERHGRFRRFYPAAGYLEGKKEVLAVLQNETSNDVARYILKNPGHNQSTMCEALGISPSLANWHVKRLVKAELVRKEREGRSVHYYPGPGWDEISNLPDNVELLGAGGRANA